jgi:hypothetical protein
MQAAPESSSSDKKGFKTEVHPSIAVLTQSSSARVESALKTSCAVESFGAVGAFGEID